MNRRLLRPSFAGAAVAVVIALGLLLPAPGRAAKRTPAAWRQRVTAHPKAKFVGQFKHVGWSRDRNRNFIDDEIDQRYGPGDSINVIVELNERYEPDSVSALLGPFGRIAYIGQLISCAYVRGVPFGLLDSLAAMPVVAMVEWQSPIRLALDTAGRAIEAEKSVTYMMDVAARDYGGGLDGSGVRVAVIDDGIWRTHPALVSAVVGGFDATIYEDANGNGIDDSCEPAGASCSDIDDEKGDGSTVPESVGGEDHATHMAGLIAARPQVGVDCRRPTDSSTPVHCSGIAPKAEIVDVKVCTADLACDWANDVMEGIDWVGRHAGPVSMGGLNIRIANISLADASNDDGTSALSQAVNYLAAIGVIPIVAHGNADAPVAPGTKRTPAPGAASFAITVGGTNDHVSVSRDDDDHYSQYLIGPRDNPLGVVYDPFAFKPDLSAPAEKIYTTSQASSLKYYWHSGTSAAAAITSGAAALVVQKRSGIDAGSLKQLLQATADKRSVPSGWDEAYGAGFLDVAAAVARPAPGDLSFASCDGFATSSMSPCPLKNSVPSWNNWMDITLASPPQPGVANKITAKIRNVGPIDADAMVTFGVYRFGVGTLQFDVIGSTKEHFPHDVVTEVTMDWTPATESHQCVQVHIDYGDDSQFGNNTTQRNLDVAPSEYDVDVENPFMQRAGFRVVPKSNRAGWNCTVDDSTFEIGGTDGPKHLKVSFNAPLGAHPGETATCDVAVYGTMLGMKDSVLIGGVTVQTYLPKPCRLVGQVVDPKGNPVADATVVFHRDLRRDLLRGDYDRDRRAVTDRYGVFALDMVPDVKQQVIVSARRAGSGTITVRPRCGVGTLVIQLGAGGARLVSSCP